MGGVKIKWHCWLFTFLAGNLLTIQIVTSNILTLLFRYVILSASFSPNTNWRAHFLVWRQCCSHCLLCTHAGSCRDPGTLPCLLSSCVFSSRWAFSVKISVESAVTSTSPLHHTEHLCKRRATAAKHHCWQTVNTPREQCAAFNPTLNCLLVLSPPQSLQNHVE